MVSKREPVNLGVLVLSEAGTAVSQNREAGRILALRDGLELDELDRPLARRSTDNALLSDAIANALSGPDGDPSRQTTLRVARPSEAPPLLIQIVPVHDAGSVLDVPVDGAVLYLLDPARHRDLATRGVAAFFGFTPEEADLAGLLAQGLEPDDISLPSAVRRLHALVEKTGAGGVSRLIRLLRLLTLLEATEARPRLP